MSSKKKVSGKNTNDALKKERAVYITYGTISLSIFSPLSIARILDTLVALL